MGRGDGSVSFERKVLRGWDWCSDFVDISVLDYVLGFSYKDRCLERKNGEGY